MSIIEQIEQILKKDFKKTLREIYSILIENNIEIWKTISLYPTYQASNLGRVKNIKSGRISKKKIEGQHGYHSVRLYKYGIGTTVTVHKFVATAFIPNQNGKSFVDHIDNNNLNNNVSNLRRCTHQENNRNQSIRKNNTSGIKGVYRVQDSNKLKAQITINGNNKHLGYYTSSEEAKEARQKASKLYFGEFQNKCEKV